MKRAAIRNFFFCVLLCLFPFLIHPLDWSVHYSAQGTGARMWFNDQYAIEAGFSAAFLNESDKQIAEQYIHKNTFKFVFSPFIFNIVQNNYMNLNVGLNYSQWLVYEDSLYYHEMEYQRINTLYSRDYSIDLILAEVELAIPYIKGLFVAAKCGINFKWGYLNEPQYYYFDIYSFDVNHLALTYYF